jgi:hypothetical protein
MLYNQPMALDPSVNAALTTLHARRNSIDRAIEALLALDDGDGTDGVAGVASAAGMTPDDASADRVRQSSTGGGIAGVRKVLHAWPGRGFTAAQLAHAMKENGWVTTSKNPRAAARASANRLRDDPENEHVFFEDGEFVYRAPGDQREGLHDDSTQEDGEP